MDGTEALIRALENLPAKMQDGAIRSGLTAAAGVIRDEARLRAPKQSGLMAKAIRSGSSRKNQDNTFSIRVYVDERKKHGFLGYFQEYGVMPHFISAGDSELSSRKLTQKMGREGTIRALNINGEFVSGTVLHPGHRAQPFLRPALDNKADEATRAFAAKITAYIEKIGLRTGYNAFVNEVA